MDEYASLSHTNGIASIHCVYPEVRRRCFTKPCVSIWRGIARSCPAARMQDRGRPLMSDHVHILISIPRNTQCRRWSGTSRAKARSTWRGLMGTKTELCGPALLARGYLVSTVGRDEAVIREYIRNQEVEDDRLDQLNCGSDLPPTGGSRWDETAGLAYS